MWENKGKELNPWDYEKKTKTCHGCCGKGWVDTQKGAQICPICNGKGKIDSNDEPYSPFPDNPYREPKPYKPWKQQKEFEFWW